MLKKLILIACIFILSACSTKNEIDVRSVDNKSVPASHKTGDSLNDGESDAKRHIASKDKLYVSLFEFNIDSSVSPEATLYIQKYLQEKLVEKLNSDGVETQAVVASLGTIPGRDRFENSRARNDVENSSLEFSSSGVLVVTPLLEGTDSDEEEAETQISRVAIAQMPAQSTHDELDIGDSGAVIPANNTEIDSSTLKRADPPRNRRDNKSATQQVSLAQSAEIKTNELDYAQVQEEKAKFDYVLDGKILLFDATTGRKAVISGAERRKYSASMQLEYTVIDQMTGVPIYTGEALIQDGSLIKIDGSTDEAINKVAPYVLDRILTRAAFDITENIMAVPKSEPIFDHITSGGSLDRVGYQDSPGKRLKNQ